MGRSQLKTLLKSQLQSDLGSTHGKNTTGQNQKVLIGYSKTYVCVCGYKTIRGREAQEMLSKSQHTCLGRRIGV